MENSVEVAPPVIENKKTNSESTVPKAVELTAPPPAEDNAGEIAQVTRLLQEEGTLHKGQQLEPIQSAERDLNRLEMKKILKQTGIVKPWYKQITHPVTLFKNLFGRKKYEVTEAKEKKSTFRVINGEAKSTTAENTSLQEAA